jgi:hypothetical protein
MAHFASVPSAIYQVVTYLEAEKLAGRPVELPHLKNIFSGAASLPPELRERLSNLITGDSQQLEVGEGKYL